MNDYNSLFAMVILIICLAFIRIILSHFSDFE